MSHRYALAARRLALLGVACGLALWASPVQAQSSARVSKNPAAAELLAKRDALAVPRSAAGTQRNGGGFTAPYDGNTTGAPRWNRPLSVGGGSSGSCGLSGIGSDTPYETRTFSVSAPGTYDVSEVQDGYDGYIHLYRGAFDPADPCLNLIALDDDGDSGIGSSDIDGASLAAGTLYVLVSTGFGNDDFGPYAGTITGPGPIRFGALAPDVSFVLSQGVVSEAAGPYLVELRLTESLESPAQVTLRLVSGDPADLGGFTSAVVTLPFGPVTTGPIRVPIPVTNDRLPEGNETFVFELRDGSGVSVGSPSLFTLVVLDDDAGNVTATLAPVDANNDGVEDGGVRLFAVPVGGPTAAEIAAAAANGGAAPTVYAVNPATGALVPATGPGPFPAGAAVLVRVAPGAVLAFTGSPASGPLAVPLLPIPGSPRLRAVVGNPTGAAVPISGLTVAGGTLGDVALVFDPVAGAFRPVSLEGLAPAARVIPARSVVVFEVLPTGASAPSATLALAPAAAPPAGTPSILTAPFAPRAGEAAVVLALRAASAATRAALVPGDRLAVRLAPGATAGLDALDGIDLASPVGGGLAAGVGGLPLAAASFSPDVLRPDVPLTLPLLVDVPAAGAYALDLSAAPTTLAGRPLTVEVLDGGVARPLTAGGTYAFTATAAGPQGTRFGLRISVAPGVADEGAVGLDAVGAVYPNPTTSGRATVEVSVATAQTVRVTVVDVLGREVLLALDGEVGAGTTLRVPLAVSALAPGAYVVRVEGATVREARRLTVTR